MMKLNQMLATGGLAIALCLSASEVMAQNNGGGAGGRGGRGGNRGNFDPAQFQQRMMERYKEALEVKDDAEWGVIQPLIQKVMDARMAVGFGGGRGGMFGRGPQRGGQDNAQPAAQPARGPGAGNPEAEALQKAIDAKASGAELKAALTKYIAARKDKQAALEKAQADLRKVLTVRQEAILTSMGTL